MTGSSDAGEPGTPEGVITCTSSESNEANAYTGTNDGPSPTTHMEAEQPISIAPAMVEHPVKVTAEVLAGIDNPPVSREQNVVVAAAPQVPANAEDTAGTKGPTTSLNAAGAASVTMNDPPPPSPVAELPPLPVDFVELTQDSYFVHPAMRSDVSDAFFVAVAQMRPCGLTQDDRVGKYRQREEGFVGMCCKHCGGQPGFGRYFPGSFDSFLNGKNCEGIVRHVAHECLRVPSHIREVVLELGQRETIVPGRLRYGSRKRFFSEIWKKLRSAAAVDLVHPEPAAGVTAMADLEDGSKVVASSSPEDPSMAEMWNEMLKDCDLVEPADRHLVSDILLGTLAQMKRTEVTENDRIGRCKNHPIGFVGMCCKWCGGKAGKPGFGRYFASSIRSLAQADSCQHMVKHVTEKCTEIPPEIREKLVLLNNEEQQTKEVATGRNRYGSRKMFFRRLWSRMHGNSASDKATHATGLPEPPLVLKCGTGDPGDPKPTEVINEDTTDWDQVLEGSTLVTADDRGLISPAQFAALAQMRACRLTESDKTGWYKDRDIGFGGFCCRHCGGKVSFGRYFPNNMRSFAQTTSSHTVISHIAQCTQVPEPIKSSVMTLQQGERLLSDSAVYGSRKIFYDRIWSRLHGVTQKSEEMVIDKSERLVKDNIDDNNKRIDPPDEAGVDPFAKPDEKRQRVQEIHTSLV